MNKLRLLTLLTLLPITLKPAASKASLESLGLKERTRERIIEEELENIHKELIQALLAKKKLEQESLLNVAAEVCPPLPTEDYRAPEQSSSQTVEQHRKDLDAYVLGRLEMQKLHRSHELFNAETIKLFIKTDFADRLADEFRQIDFFHAQQIAFIDASTEEQLSAVQNTVNEALTNTAAYKITDKEIQEELTQLLEDIETKIQQTVSQKIATNHYLGSIMQDIHALTTRKSTEVTVYSFCPLHGILPRTGQTTLHICIQTRQKEKSQPRSKTKSYPINSLQTTLLEKLTELHATTAEKSEAKKVFSYEWECHGKLKIKKSSAKQKQDLLPTGTSGTEGLAASAKPSASTTKATVPKELGEQPMKTAQQKEINEVTIAFSKIIIILSNPQCAPEIKEEMNRRLKIYNQLITTQKPENFDSKTALAILRGTYSKND